MKHSTEPVNPMVSLILPVFNVAPYLGECLDSLLNQNSYYSVEIILVEDCSTDDSKAICRKYAEQNPQQIHLFENETNQGVSVSRNRGLDHATGRYIVFVDPDDVLPETAVHTMVDAAEQSNADIVKGNLILFSERGERYAPDRAKSNLTYHGPDVLTALYRHKFVRGHAGGKLFRRKLAADVRFTTGVRMAQDLLFFCEIFARANTLLIINTDVYRYRKHGTGSTGGKYLRGSYVDWLNSVENCGRFATTREQRRAHQNLQVRSLTQVARECRYLDDIDTMSQVLKEIEQRIARWKITGWGLVVTSRPDFASLSRYVKLKMALKTIRKRLAA